MHPPHPPLVAHTEGGRDHDRYYSGMGMTALEACRRRHGDGLHEGSLGQR